MKEITRIVSGDNKVLNVGAEVLKFDKLKRENYTTAKDYIIAYQRQFNILGRYGIAPHPFTALYTILHALRKELPSVNFTFNTLKRQVPTETTINNFGEYYKELIIESNTITEETISRNRSTKIARSSSPAKTNRSSSPSSSRGGRGQRGRGGRIRRGND
jgi:hypothetical protein